jgi:superoxide dismutase
MCNISVITAFLIDLLMASHEYGIIRLQLQIEHAFNTNVYSTTYATTTNNSNSSTATASNSSNSDKVTTASATTAAAAVVFDNSPRHINHSTIRQIMSVAVAVKAQDLYKYCVLYLQWQACFAGTAGQQDIKKLRRQLQVLHQL